LRNGENVVALLQPARGGAAPASHCAALLVIYPVLFSGKIAKAE